MMISPWVIYWIDTLSSMQDLAHITFCLGGIGVVAFCVVLGSLSELEKNLRHTILKALKVATIICGVSILIGVFIPSKETMYAMLVVDKITPENIEMMRAFGVETVQQLGDAIANSINKIEVK